MEPKASIIIIGLNPSKNSGATRRGSALHRLHEWADYLGLRHYSFGNLSDDPHWDFKFKSLDENFIVQMVQGYDIIVSLGTQVHSTLKRLGFESFKLPHPSPLNRQINDPAYILSELDKCKVLICRKS